MSCKIDKFLALTAVLALVLVAPATANAWERGNTKVLASFQTVEQWDSNIFYDHDDPKSDWITLLRPSLKGEVGFGAEGKHKAYASYFGEMGIFAKYDDQNYGNHDAIGGVNLDFNKYSLDTNNRFQFTSDRAGTEFENRTLRKIDTFNTVLGLHFNKFDFDFGYQYYWLDYLSDTLESFNRRENSGSATGYVQVMPKTKALLEFTYTNLEYPDASGRNGNAYRVLAGVKGDITSKLTGIAKAGYKLKKYEKSTNEDYSGAAAEIDLMYVFNDRVDMLFGYTREPFESTYSNNNYYTGDHFLARLNYRFGNGFVAFANGKYFHNDYPNVGAADTKKRRDDEWVAGCGLDYFWKEWISTGAGYEFHQRASTITSRKYDENIVSMNAKLMF
jgi:hypothetical protein